MDIISAIEQIPISNRCIYALTLSGMAMVVFAKSSSGIRTDFFWGFLFTLSLVVFVIAVYWGVSKKLIDFGELLLADWIYLNILPVVGGFTLITFRVTRRSDSQELAQAGGERCNALTKEEQS
jgi:hypothetical protein